MGVRRSFTTPVGTAVGQIALPSCTLYNSGLSSLVGLDIKLDAVGRQFEPYLDAGCVCMLLAPLWCDLGCCSRTVVVIKAAANPRLCKFKFNNVTRPDMSGSSQRSSPSTSCIDDLAGN